MLKFLKLIFFSVYNYIMISLSTEMATAEIQTSAHYVICGAKDRNAQHWASRNMQIERG